MKKSRAFVAMSGGVDSSVSAALLQQRGYDVVGVFMKTWSPDWLPCTWPEERRDAIRVAAKLGIPCLTFDLENEYRRDVVDYMVREYRAGRTPNPDVMCNKHVKFGAFFEKAMGMGADYVATGHYVIYRDGKMFASVDKEKDQSYFLWTLTQQQLAKTLFPVGGLKKSEVRKLAKKFGLPVAEKKDSQGLCFVGHVDMKDFLKRYIKTKQGDVLDMEGNIIGRHEGAELYTIGERHGFVITKKGTNDFPFYVVSKNIENNTITASSRTEKSDVGRRGDSSQGGVSSTILSDVNWISGSAPDLSKKYSARIRYRQLLQMCKISSYRGVTSVAFDGPQMAAPGQSCVIYDGDTCLGGGIIV